VKYKYLAAGGRSPYSYTWDKTSQTTPSINKLVSGIYVATVTDVSGCVTTIQATVQDSISRYKMTTSYQALPALVVAMRYSNQP
jgi:hypothetical protein